MSSLKTDKILVIVESPNKVKTISNILKKAGFSSASVSASVGHIMELGNGGTAFNSGITPEKQFKMNLSVMSEKKKVVNELMTKAKAADKIFIMTDGDREGEIIAWSLIKFCKLDQSKCFRAITQEITPKAVVAAIENPVPFNNSLVEAGLARMMTDKLIGYGLSPIGKKYIGARSIGRCQSIGLKLVSDREHEIQEFIPELYFQLFLNFNKDSVPMRAKYVGYKEETIEKFTKQADVDAVINNCKGTPFIISEISTVKHQEAPKLPFCTATFQQEAAAKLGLRVKDAMNCAQKLFEGINIDGDHIGLITYMRTDSSELSKEFLPELEQYVKTAFGNNSFVGQRKVKHKSTDQIGHEALRVVNPELTPTILSQHLTNNLLLKVYELIWQRTVASVMPNAVIAETVHKVSNNGHVFSFSLNKVETAGYRIVYDKQTTIATPAPSFTIGEELLDTELESLKKFTQPKPRYTEASLVKELQQREIGRPSTYASIVETILSPTRGYATLEEKHIVPTDRGIQLAEYCDRAFPKLINLGYTKDMESCLDKIASGNISMLDYMDSFYSDLKTTINSTQEVGIEHTGESKICPKCESPMVIRRSRFGKLFYGCSTYPKCNGIVNID